jgi:hypothetical protein
MYLPRNHVVTDYEGNARELINDFIEQEFVAFPVPLHDDMLDSLARICEVEGVFISSGKTIPLKLAWPIAKPKRNNAQIHQSTGSWM